MEHQELQRGVERGSAVYTKAALQKFENEASEWQRIGGEFSLETAYQRFVHAPNVPSAATESHWRQREKEQIAKESAR